MKQQKISTTNILYSGPLQRTSVDTASQLILQTYQITAYYITLNKKPTNLWGGKDPNPSDAAFSTVFFPVSSDRK